MKRLSYHGTVVITAAALWLLIVGVGLGVLHRYNLKPEDDSPSPAFWAAERAPRSSNNLSSLFVFSGNSGEHKPLNELQANTAPCKLADVARGLCAVSNAVSTVSHPGR